MQRYCIARYSVFVSLASTPVVLGWFAHRHRYLLAFWRRIMDSDGESYDCVSACVGAARGQRNKSSDEESFDCVGACIGAAADGLADVQPTVPSACAGAARVDADDYADQSSSDEEEAMGEEDDQEESTRRFVRDDVEPAPVRAARIAYDAVMGVDHQLLDKNGKTVIVAKPSLRWHGKSIALDYASDASGIDAPLMALRVVAEEWKKFGTEIAVNCRFQSEHPQNQPAVRFLKHNHDADVVYLDMFKRDQHGGVDSKNNRVPLPAPYTVSIYTAGTDCTSISSANRHSSRLNLKWSAMDCGNKSSRALLQSIRTAGYLKSRAFLLENVNTLDVEALVKFLRANLKGVVVCALRANSLDLLAKTERDRWYVLCARKEAVLVPVALWPQLVDKCRVVREPFDPSELLLAADSAEVSKEFERKTRRIPRPGACKTSDLKWTAHQKSMDRAIGRTQCSTQGPAAPLPLLDASVDWNTGLSPRLKGLAGLFTRWVDSAHQSCPRRDPYHYVLDLDSPANHNRVLFPGLAPVLLRKHYVGLILKHPDAPARYARHLLGLEHLFYMGCPRDVRTGGISDVQLRSLAGNSMTVPTSVALMTVLLAVLDWEVELSEGAHACNDDDFIVHVVTPLASTPMATKQKQALPGFSISRALKCSCLCPWDIHSVPMDVPSKGIDWASKCAAGDLGLELLEQHGHTEQIRQYYSVAANPGRSLITFAAGAGKGSGKIDLTRHPCKSPLIQSLRKIADIVAKVTGTRPSWSEIKLRMVCQGDAIEVEAASVKRTLVLALPAGASSADDGVGWWWRSKQDGEDVNAPGVVTGSLGPLMFDLMPVTAGRGKNNPLLSRGGSMPGLYTPGDQHLVLGPHQIALFVPRRKVILAKFQYFDTGAKTHGAYHAAGFVPEPAVEETCSEYTAPMEVIAQSKAKRTRKAPEPAEPLGERRVRRRHACASGGRRIDRPVAQGLQTQLPALVACKHDGREWLAPDGPIPTAALEVPKSCAVELGAESDESVDLQALCMTK